MKLRLVRAGALLTHIQLALATIAIATGCVHAGAAPPDAGAAPPDVGASSPLTGPVPDGFALRDFLGRTWRNESVQFPLTDAQLLGAQQKRALVGPDGKEVLYQVVPGGNGWKLAFLADLNPFEKRFYRFTERKATAQSDIRIEENYNLIRLTNSRIGIAIRKRPRGAEGPIAAIRLASGAWVGDSTLPQSPGIRSYTATVTTRGAAFAEVVCRTDFGLNRQWTLRVRLDAGEPVVLVDEEFSTGDDTAFKLSLSPGFGPDSLYYRYGKLFPGTVNSEGTLATWKLVPAERENVFTLEPWLHWWQSVRQGNWCGFYRAGGKDMLALGAREADVWIDPTHLADHTQSPAQIPFALEKGELKATFPLRGGTRKWMIEALDASAALAPLQEPNLHQAPLPQQLLIKHSDFPLDRIKDYTLQWQGDEGDHLHLFLTRDDVARFRQTFKADPGTLEEYRHDVVNKYTMGQQIAYYVGTGDAALGRHLAQAAQQWIQATVDMYLKQDTLVTVGFAPHGHVDILTALNLVAVVWSSELSPAERERIKAQVAFLGYTVNRDDFWSPPRGYAANPNMTTTVAAFRADIAITLATHPQAATWMATGMDELKDVELDGWADSDGGWLEAPHYAMVSYDYILGIFLMAHNAGFNDYLYDPKMKKVAEWFAKVSTPPDARIQDWRHLPAIGNTENNEPTSEFGTLAYLWKDRDPQFAATMQWMHLQQGSPTRPVVSGFCPTLAGYRSLLLDPTIPALAPGYTSEIFPQTGVVLRHNFPSARETQLLLIAGSNHAHYDMDSGSVTLWGKGRIIADDFGYEGYTPASDHNMVESASAPGATIATVREFASTTNLDYIRAVKHNAWTRQVAFVKDAAAAGPSYFVFCDSLQKPETATWRMWFAASKVTPDTAGHVRVQGNEDVDTDVFFSQPAGIGLSVEEKTRRSTSGLLPNGQTAPISRTQLGVIATNEPGQSFIVAVYPRLKTEKPPVFTSLADGHVIKVKSTVGTDYVFLSPQNFSFHDAAVDFQGTVGCVQFRGAALTLSLGAAGSVAAGGQRLEAENAASQRWPVRQ